MQIKKSGIYYQKSIANIFLFAKNKGLKISELFYKNLNCEIINNIIMANYEMKYGTHYHINRATNEGLLKCKTQLMYLP